MIPTLEGKRSVAPGRASDCVLRVQDLEVKFFAKGGVVHAVNGVSFELRPGERMAVVGESGSGKSVMTMSLIGLIAYPGRITEGEVELNGRDIVGISAKELNLLRGPEAAMVFQDPMTSLNPVLKIEDQLIPSMMRHLGITRRQARDRAEELLRQVGISDPAARLSAYPHELSGGMRQRVLIAIALSCKPNLILADEPTTALDVTIQAQIIALLGDLADETGAAVLFVTHDLGLVARFAHKVAVMYAGRIVEQGAVRDIYRNPQHPYTRALLRSIPAISGPRLGRLTQIEGAPPPLHDLGDGCSFAPRCPVATSRCRTELPLLVERERGHVAACWVTEDDAGALEGTFSS